MTFCLSSDGQPWPGQTKNFVSRANVTKYWQGEFQTIATVMERINGVDHQLEQAVSEVGATVQDGNTSRGPADQYFSTIFPDSSLYFSVVVLTWF